MSDDVIVEAPTTDAQSIEQSAAAVDTTADQPTDESSPEAKAERTFTQDEVDKVVQKRLAKEHRRIEKYAAAEAELRIIKEQIQRQQTTQEAPKGMPQPAQFQDYESYVEALTDWKVDQKLAARQAETEAHQRQRQAAERASQVQAKLSSASDKYDDFEDVALNPSVPITQAMAEAIAESDMGGDVAYYLGSNLVEALRISQLSAVGQIREIAKIEAKLTAAPPVTTKAPPPINPVGQRASVSKDPSKMTDSEFAKWRKAQIAQRGN